MANTVYTEEEITLQDGTELTLRPSPIARLRRIMKEWKKFEGIEDEDESFDIFINCCGIALEKDFRDKFESVKADQTIKEEKGQVLSSKYKEYLEETLEMDTIYKIMEVCAGMKLNDPNLLAAAAAQREAGTN